MVHESSTQELRTPQQHGTCSSQARGPAGIPAFPGVDVPRHARTYSPSVLSSQPPISRLPPAPSAIHASFDIGTRMIKWLNVLLPAVTGISILGALVTLFALIAPIQDPARLDAGNPDAATSTLFSRETVRTLLGVAFLLFVLALGFANVAALLVVFHGDDMRDGFNGLPRLGDKRKRVGRAIDYKWYGIASALLLQFLLFGAFLALGLVVVAYVQPVGWIAVGFTAFFTILTAFLWLFRPSELLLF